jgi:ATP-binding cassette, subfamily C, bacterial exporter for protease/lipase
MGNGFLGGPKLLETRSLKQRFNIVVFLSIVTNLLALVQPVFMLHVYDYVLPSESLATLMYLTLMATFLLVVTGTLEFLRSRIFADAAWELDEQLRPICFRASYELGKKSDNAGRTIFTSDLETVKQFLTGGAPASFLDLPWTVIFLVALFALNPWLGLLSTGFAILVLVAAILNEMSLRTYLREGSTRGQKAQRLAEDVLRATDAIEAMKFRNHAIGRWSREAEAQAAYSRATAARSGVWTSVVRTLRLSLQVLTLAAAAWLVLLGELTAGTMIAASIIGARALAPIDQAVAGWRGTALAQISWRRLGGLEASNSQRVTDRTDPPPVSGTIEAEGLVVTAANGAPIIAGVNLRIPQGYFVGLVGPSGSGKTTLARALAGAVTPDGGLVRLDGIDMRSWPDERLATAIGYLPQSVQLLGGTVSENIRRLGPRDDEAVVAAAEKSGAHRIISALPETYETDVGDGGTSVSGGQRAMIGLARALYGDPAVVILDEPNASLDTDGRRALAEALSKLRAARKTVILVSHDVGSLRSFDQLIIMRGGRIEKMGPPSELLVANQPAQNNTGANGTSKSNNTSSIVPIAIQSTRPTPEAEL